MKIKIPVKAKKKLTSFKKKAVTLWKDKKNKKIILFVVGAVLVYLIIKSKAKTTTTTTTTTGDSGSKDGTTVPPVVVINPTLSYSGNYAPELIYGAHPDDWVPSIIGTSKRWLISDNRTIAINNDEELLYIIGGANFRTSTPLKDYPYQSNIDFIMEKWIVKKSMPSLAYWWYATDNWGDRNGRRGLPKSEAAFIGVHFRKVA